MKEEEVKAAPFSETRTARQKKNYAQQRRTVARDHREHKERKKGGKRGLQSVIFAM